MSYVDIYTKPNCPFCVKAKALLQQNNIPYKEYTLGANATVADIHTRIANMGLSIQVRTVPQIFYTDKAGTVHYIGGYTDLVARQAILGT